jgi:hypothetical protein
MEQERIEGLARLLASRTGDPADIKAMQTILKAEGLYNGKVDGDIGMKTATGLMAAFRQHPALLNNASPAIVRAMEQNGFGTQLRELVASNPALRSQLVASAVDLVDKSPAAHKEQQAKLSLLGYYNYEGGIDGVKGREHREAIRQLRELNGSATRASTPMKPAVIPKTVTPASSIPTVSGSGASFEQMRSASPDMIWRLAGIIDVTNRRPFLQASFGDVTTSNGNPVTTGIDDNAVWTPEDRNRGGAEFLGRHRTQNLAILDLLRCESNGGDYNIAFGGIKKDFTSMTIDEVRDWQRRRINSGAESAAVGRYQIMYDKLGELKRELGLTGQEIFNEEMQDTLGLALLVKRGYMRYLESAGTRQDEYRMMRQLSREWAALPDPKTGRSYYDGVGSNRKLVDTGPVLEALRAEHRAYQQHKNNPEMQNSAMESLINVADTLRGRKKPEEATPITDGTDALSPTPVRRMTEIFTVAHGTPKPQTGGLFGFLERNGFMPDFGVAA